MSTITSSPTTTDAEAALRGRLRQNAAFSGLGGLIGAAACVPLADLMGFDQWWILLAISLGLLGFAGLVWAASKRPADKLVGDALEISIADASWVIGSVVVVALGVFSTAGVAIMLGQAAMVAFFGTTQFLHRSRMT